MNILELPKEIILEIWSYVTESADIVRFEVTCNQIRTLSLKIERQISLKATHPVELWKTVLSRDLPNLRKLDLNYTINSDNAHNVEGILDILTVLSSLRGLRALNCQFFNTRSRPELVPKFLALSRILKKMTWLEDIDSSIQLEDDIGALFRDHPKLTTLRIGSWNTGIGYSQLTQVKDLAVSVYAGDEVLDQVLDLDQLSSLDISWSEISNECAMKISKLTNLETLQISGVESAVDRNFLGSLPKLNYLVDDIDTDAYPILSSLSTLTFLELSCSQKVDQLMPMITTLTALRYLDITADCDNSANFSALTKLTALKIYPKINLEHIQLPRGLKSLWLRQKLNESIMEDISSIDSIEELSFGIYSDLPSAVSRMTNLREIIFGTNLHPTSCQFLTGLPALRTMSLGTIFDRDINELQLLTQLFSLTITLIHSDCTMTLQQIRQKLPFIVYKLT
jgi:hypothetical protein